jgi:site-specific recombinase
MGKEGKPMQYDKADQQNCPRRVVFYGRVSTELEAQISALKNQMNWYLELAEHHPNWTVVGQYADEGISGTGMKTRPSFMKMLRDARKKKFDLNRDPRGFPFCPKHGGYFGYDP